MGEHRRASGRRHRGRHRLALASLVTVAMVVGAGVAVAAWSSSGGGTSASRASSALPPTTTAVPAAALTSGLLYPGGTGDARVTVNNPNPYPVRLTAVTSTAGGVSASGGSGTCSTTGVSLTSSTPSGSTVAAKGSATLTLAGAASMSNSSDTGCQGATFSIPVTVTVESTT